MKESYRLFVLTFWLHSILIKKERSFQGHERYTLRLAIFCFKFSSMCLKSKRTENYRNPKTIWYGTETILYMAPKIWSKVPETTKMSSSWESFTLKIRKRKPECVCRLCVKYLQHFGFVNVCQCFTLLIFP